MTKPMPLLFRRVGNVFEVGYVSFKAAKAKNRSPKTVNPKLNKFNGSNKNVHPYWPEARLNGTMLPAKPSNNQTRTQPKHTQQRSVNSIS